MFVNAWLTRNAYETNDNEYMDMWDAALLAGEPSANALERFWIKRCEAVFAVLRKDKVAAAEHYTNLAPDKGTVLFPALFSVDHVLGLLAQTIGNLDDAQNDFEDALTFCRKANYRPELAWTCYDYADMLIQRNDSVDLSKARELLDEADQITSDLGMKPLAEKVAVLKERLYAEPAPKTEYPDGLTEREVEVLRLVAAGKSNRDIGEELVIALDTVARHVSNIYSKTGSGNRADAAAYALRQGLIS